MAAGLRPREVRAMLAATLEMGEGDLVAEIGALPGLLEASSLEEIIRAAAAGARGDEGGAGGVGEAEEAVARLLRVTLEERLRGVGPQFTAAAKELCAFLTDDA